MGGGLKGEFMSNIQLTNNMIYAEDAGKDSQLSIEDVEAIDIDIPTKSGLIFSGISSIKGIIEKDIENQLPEYFYPYYISAERKYFVNLKQIEGWKIIKKDNPVLIFKSGHMVSGYDLHITDDFKNKWEMYNKGEKL